MKRNKDIVLFIILVITVLFIAFQISSRMKSSFPDYSVLNKSEKGYSIIFKALKELNYDVERTTKEINLQDKGSIQIVVDDENLDINSKDISEWVKAGGVLVYFGGYYLDTIDFGEEEEKGNLFIYKYGKGVVIEGSANDFANITLKNKRDSAYEIITELSNYPDRTICFNETYMFFHKESTDLWSITPLYVKFIIYQFVLVVIAFIIYKGKRFGKTIPLYEEEERSENEYLYSAAFLYQQTKCWDLMFNNYYNSFLKEIRLHKDNWLEYWQQEQLPLLNTAREVFNFNIKVQSKMNIGDKEYMHAVTMLEQLKDILRKRRELYWKSLKK